jgi:hypothetical protein
MSDPTPETATPGFAADILPLFRERDMTAMRFIIDLSSYEDVRDNAAEIVDRIADGTMPCDDPWPPEWLDLLRAWISTGMSR